MRLDVDEARRNRQAGGVDGPGATAGEIRPDRGNAAIVYGEIANRSRAAGPVEQQSTADDDLVGHGVWRMRSPLSRPDLRKTIKQRPTPPSSRIAAMRSDGREFLDKGNHRPIRR
jgi:hypothetical protein